jgi:predicted kinase
MHSQHEDVMGLFVLVGGWPGSGKSTLARVLAAELRLPLLAKDEIKEALADGLGRPDTVAESQRLGRAAVLAVLRVAQRCPAAVLDSTWFSYTRSLLATLPGRLVEVRCVVPLEVARARYYARAGTRHAGHHDLARTGEELWGEPSRPLGVDTAIEVDTTTATDARAIAMMVLRTAGVRPQLAGTTSYWSQR